MCQDDITDEIWKRNEIDSPCVKICVVHPQARLCVGCHRSIEEIRDWSRYSSEQRQDIIATLKGRATQFRGKRRGRRSRLS